MGHHRPQAFDSQSFMRWRTDERTLVAQQLIRGIVRIRRHAGGWHGVTATGATCPIPRWVGQRAQDLGIVGRDLRR